ncbi:hypothetical protein AOLI_G00142140 [Acnodon oligacanthus]
MRQVIQRTDAFQSYGLGGERNSLTVMIAKALQLPASTAPQPCLTKKGKTQPGATAELRPADPVELLRSRTEPDLRPA